MQSRHRELELRAHIHDLLYEYALTHITSDYKAFTYQASHEESKLNPHCLSTHFQALQILSASLFLIPTREQTSLALEPTLTEQIVDALHLSDLPPFHEQLNADDQVGQYIKAFLDSASAWRRARSGRSRSERCWLEDYDGEQHSSFHWHTGSHAFQDDKFCRPISPILTMRAIRNTPKLGRKTAQQHVVGPTSFLLRRCSIEHLDTSQTDAELAEAEKVEENINDVLYVCAITLHQRR